MRPTQLLRVLVVALLAVLALGWPASAASTVTITLTSRGPSPAAADSLVGQTVVFTNKDTVNHYLSGSAFGPNPVTVPNGSSYDYAFTAAGTFAYDDFHGFIVVDSKGTVTVTKPAGSPSPKPSATAKPSATPSRSASPTPAATSSGTATGPGLGTTVLPSPSAPAASGAPVPNIAPPVAAVPTPTPSVSRSPAPNYSGHGLVQGSAHRYGLPAALAVVAITGVLSLLVRLLLAQAPAKAQP